MKKTDAEIRAEDRLLLAADEVIREAGIDSHDLDQWAKLKRPIVAAARQYAVDLAESYPARHRPPAVFDCECWLCQRIAEAARWAAAQREGTEHRHLNAHRCVGPRGSGLYSLSDPCDALLLLGPG